MHIDSEGCYGKCEIRYKRETTTTTTKKTLKRNKVQSSKGYDMECDVHVEKLQPSKGNKQKKQAE